MVLNQSWYTHEQTRNEANKFQLPVTVAYAFTNYRESQGQTIKTLMLDIAKLLTGGLYYE